jgi:hypothetical protein
MEDTLHALRRFGKQFAIAYVPRDDLDLVLHSREVCQTAGGEIIEYTDFVTARDKSLNQARSDKSGATGHKEYGHAPSNQA